MPRWLWTDGRLSWGVIAVVVFATVSVLAFDVAWRVARLPFDRLAIYALVIDAAAAAAVIAIARRLIRARRRA
jgi:hypothetical protein